MFSFVMYVTCSTHAVADKLKWIKYADKLTESAYQDKESSIALGASGYAEIMLTLTQMAKIDPFCRVHSYKEFFRQGNYGLNMEFLSLKQNE